MAAVPELLAGVPLVDVLARFVVALVVALVVVEELARAGRGRDVAGRAVG